MDNINTLDEALAPFSRWIAKTFFNEQYGRTWSQKVEDEQGIPKDKFHTMLAGTVVTGFLLYFLFKE